jgi:hypothetical protein
MPVDLDPKRQFRLLSPDHHKQFANLITDPAMRLAMNVALTQLCQTGITTDELNGAKKYMAILSSLADAETPKRMPQKTLKQS